MSKRLSPQLLSDHLTGVTYADEIRGHIDAIEAELAAKDDLSRARLRSLELAEKLARERREELEDERKRHSFSVGTLKQEEWTHDQTKKALDAANARISVLEQEIRMTPGGLLITGKP